MSKDEEPRRGTDPSDLDARKLRNPVSITLSREDLSRALVAARTRAFWVGLITAVIVSAIAGYIVGRVVTHVVRHDVGIATVQNCKDTSAAAQALEKFLVSDANYAGQLGALDGVTADLERDLSVQIRKLGPIIPSRIATDYAQLGRLYQKIGRVRVQTTRLWAGTSRKGPSSLAQDVLTAIHGHCDRLLSP